VVDTVANKPVVKSAERTVRVKNLAEQALMVLVKGDNGKLVHRELKRRARDLFPISSITGHMRSLEREGWLAITPTD
jgi:hypothetical protein